MNPDRVTNTDRRGHVGERMKTDALAHRRVKSDDWAIYLGGQKRWCELLDLGGPLG